MRRGLLCLAAWLWLWPVAADAQELRVEVFTRDGCPHCEAALAYLAEIPGVQVEVHEVTGDPAALVRLRELGAAHGIDQLGVPAFLVDGDLLVGFGPATRAELDSRLRGRAPRSPRIWLPLFGDVTVESAGLPLFTVAIGLVDGFNPCAMWVLLFLLSLLVHVRSRARMALIAGTFVVVSGAAYYAFMAAWLGFFVLAGYSRGLQIVLGVLALAAGSIHIKDFFTLGRGPSLSIPASAKPHIYARVRRVVQARALPTALGAAVVLAVMVNVVELLCSAGLPAVYSQVLAAHALPAWQRHAYLALYILVYMLDDAIMVTIAVVTLSHRKLQEGGARVLQLISGSVLFLLGTLLLWRPAWLSWS